MRVCVCVSMCECVLSVCVCMCRVIRNSVTHVIKSVHLNGGNILICDLQIDRESLQIFVRIS